MTDETFNKIMKKIDEFDFSDYLKKEKQRVENGVKKVAKTSYINWLTQDFINKFEHNVYDSEFFLYHSKDFSALDIRNEKHLGYFDSFLDIVAKEQRVQEYHEPVLSFEEYDYVFKYKNEFYNRNIIVGQGSITRIKKVEKPDYSYIDLDKFFEKEENKNESV